MKPFHWSGSRPPERDAAAHRQVIHNRRRKRKRTHDNFPSGAKLVVKSTASPWRNLQDARLENTLSDYGSRTDLTFRSVTPQSSAAGVSGSETTTKVVFNTPSRKTYRSRKMIQEKKDTDSVSLGYFSGDLELDEELSNLSIDDTNEGPSAFKHTTLEEPLDGGGKASPPYLTLNDLKMDTLKASLKIHKDIHVVLPSRGYQVPTQLNDCHELKNIITIETSKKINIEESFRKAGMRIFQVSPIISIQPCDVKFCRLYPAIIQVPLRLDPSAGDNIFCLYTKASMDDLITQYSNIRWRSDSDMVGECLIKDGRVSFEAYQFGIFVLALRPQFVYRSSIQNISAQVGGVLRIPGFPSVKVSFPHGTTKVDRASATIHLDTEKTVSEVLEYYQVTIDSSVANGCGLASPIIQLEPHGSQFKDNPVVVTLPIPDYDQIVSILGNDTTLVILQSDTHSSQVSAWEQLHVEYHISRVEDEYGKSMVVVTFPVSHFSYFKVCWNILSTCLFERKLGMAWFHVPVLMKCRANMQEYPNQDVNSSPVDKKTGSGGDNASPGVSEGRGFGLQVLIYHAEKTLPELSGFKHNVGESLPKLMKPGKMSVRLASNYFGADVQVCEDERLEEELNFGGDDVDAQFMGRFKPGFDIARGCFGKVVVSRQENGDKIFRFNLQKKGNECEIEDCANQKEEMSIINLANNLSMMEGDNWKQFALELGMTKQQIVDAHFKADSQPFQKIINNHLQNGGTSEQLVNALYKCQRTLEAIGPYSGGGRNFSRSSSKSSGIGSLCADTNNNPLGIFMQDNDSDKSLSSPGQKRVRHASHRRSEKGECSAKSTTETSKRRRLSELGAYRRRSSPYKEIGSSDSSSDSEDEELKRRKLTQHFIWEVSRHLNNDKWRALGRTLGLGESIVIGVGQRGLADYQECAFQMLVEWLERYPKKCTYGNLCAALQREGLNAVAMKMKNIDFNKYD